MSLINDNRKSLSLVVVKFLVDEREPVQGGDYYAFLVVYSILEHR